MFLIQKIFEKKHKKVGFRVIKMILENDYNLIMNHKKIIRIMKKYEMVAMIRKKNPYKNMMKKSLEHRVAPNIINRQFDPEKPDQIYSTDITYLFYGNGKKAYLSATKDLASKEIIHYNLSEKIDMNLVLHDLKKKLNKLPKNVRNNLIIHSDQGVHYTSAEYSKVLKDFGINQSMSRRGNCIDNCPIESFFGHLKDEINLKECQTFDKIKKIIDKYIYYYNNYRYQWGLKKMSPVGYRKHF